MHLSHIILAILPALALAQDSAGPTSSPPVTLTKTITLARAHTTASLASQGVPSGAAASTGRTTAHTSAPTASLAPVSGAAGLEAGKFALAGVAGMIAVALM